MTNELIFIIGFSHVRQQLHSRIHNEVGNDRGNLLTHQEDESSEAEPASFLSFYLASANKLSTALRSRSSS